MASLLKMLVVDDDQEMVAALVRQFEEEDFIVDAVDDGIPALEKIRQYQYDIVLLDLKLPRLDGVSLLKELKKIQRLPNVLVITAVDNADTAIECVKLGAKDYISKPYDPEDLLDVVIRTLGS